MSSKRLSYFGPVSPRKSRFQDNLGEWSEADSPPGPHPVHARLIRVSSEETILTRMSSEEDLNSSTSHVSSSSSSTREKKHKRHLLEDIEVLEYRLDESQRMINSLKRENMRLRASFLRLLGTDPSPENVEQLQGTTACVAAWLGRLDWLVQMAEHGADLTSTDYAQGRTALHYAAEKDHVDLVQYFLSDIALSATAGDRFGISPLEIALRANSFASAQLLEVAKTKQSQDTLMKEYNSALYFPRESLYPSDTAAISSFRVPRSGSSSLARTQTSGDFISKSFSNPHILISNITPTASDSSSTVVSPFPRRYSDASAPPMLSKKLKHHDLSPRPHSYAADDSQRISTTSSSKQQKGIKKFLFENWRSSKSKDESESPPKKDKSHKRVKSSSTLSLSAPMLLISNCQVPHCKCKHFKQSQDPSTCDCGHFRASHRAPGHTGSESMLSGLEGLKFMNEEDRPLLIPQDPFSSSEWPKILNPKARKEDGLRDFKKSWNGRFGHNWSIEASELVFLRKLGDGTSACVYEGTYQSRPVAIKVMTERPSHMKSKSKMRQEMLEEFSVLTSVDSEHILKFYGVVLDPTMCLVTEYCSKGTLRDLLDPDTTVADSSSVPITWKQGLTFFLHALMGVDALHSRKPPVVHRDLKSLNLLIDSAMNLKVADFGLSRFVLNPEQQTTLAKLRGTYTYTAPEVYFGNIYSTKSDMYSLGVVLWEIANAIATGKWSRPFAEYSYITMDFQVIIQVAKKNLRPSIPAGVPQAIVQIIERLWNPAHESRPGCSDLIPEIITIILDLELNGNAPVREEKSSPRRRESSRSSSSPPRRSQKSQDKLLQVEGSESATPARSPRKKRDRTRSVSDPEQIAKDILTKKSKESTLSKPN